MGPISNWLSGSTHWSLLQPMSKPISVPESTHRHLSPIHSSSRCWGASPLPPPLPLLKLKLQGPSLVFSKPSKWWWCYLSLKHRISIKKGRKERKGVGCPRPFNPFFHYNDDNRLFSIEAKEILYAGGYSSGQYVIHSSPEIYYSHDWRFF